MTDFYAPQPYYNRPGLPALNYRLGTYTAIRQRLLSQLTRSIPSPDQPQGVSLRRLTTRDQDDPAIALLDAVSVLADVLYFYQERIANEGYLMTATELKSVLELTRMVGYRMGSGVAASALLAFTVDDAPGSPTVVTIPKGTAIQSMPEKEELPQTFETSDEFVARLEWNSLTPRPHRPQRVDPDRRELYLVGTSTQLQAGDRLLLLDGDGRNGNANLLILEAVEPLLNREQTRIRWAEHPPRKPTSPPFQVPLNPTLLAFRQSARLFGHNAPRWEDMPDAIKQDAAVKNGKAIQGGVVLAQGNGDTLQSINTNLPSTDVRCVAIAPSGHLFAGFGNGVFRSKDNGKTWNAVTAGLTNLNVQTLLLHGADLLVGTAEGGVFRTKDGGESWTPLHLGSVRLENPGTNQVQTRTTGIPNTVVRSLLVYSPTTTIRVSGGTTPTQRGTVTGSTPNTVSLTTSDYPDWLKVGAWIAIAQQPVRIDDILSYSFITTVTVDSPFTTALSVSFNTVDGPTSTSQITLTAAANSNELTLSGTGRLTPLADGQQITLAGVTKRIQNTRSSSYTMQLQVSPAFVTPPAAGTPVLVRADLRFDAGGSNLLAGTDRGLFISVDGGANWSLLEFKDQIVRSLLSPNANNPNELLAATDAGISRSEDAGTTWTDFSTNLPGDARPVYELKTLNNKVLAGTQNGVYRRNGNQWVVDNGNEALRKPIRALAGYQDGSKFYVFVATDAGLYRYEDAATQNTTQLTHWGVTALNASSGSKTVLVGTQFKGFVEVPQTTPTSAARTRSTSTAEDATEEWFNFEIEPDRIDLDTKYPKVFEQSWIVLVNDMGDRMAIAPRQVQGVATVQRKDFAIAAEVTQLRFQPPVLPPDFYRRSTVVLMQSEVLTLAPEPLTVTVQQANIFLDPLYAQQVFLREYVAGLRSQQQVIINGKRIRALVQHVGGVMELQEGPEASRWQRLSYQKPAGDATSPPETEPVPGLTFTGVTTLLEYWTSSQGKTHSTLMAGTAGGGIFQRVPVGDRYRWEPANEGLTSLNITAIACVPEPGTSSRETNRDTAAASLTLYAATSDAGVFRAVVRGTSANALVWQAVNRNLASLQVQTLLADGHDLYAGTTRGGIAELKSGADRWAQVPLENRPVQCLAIAPNGTRFAGTAEGVFRSLDGGISWQPLNAGLTNPNITALVTYQKPGTGTVDVQDTTLLGQDTRFRDEFVVGDTVFINNTQRQVTAILSNTVMRINAALPTGEPTDPRASVNSPTTPPALRSRSFQILRVLVGTSGSGIFALMPDRVTGRLRWEPSLQQPRDLTIRCLLVHPDDRTLYAGTATGGIFRSLDDGDGWIAINQGLTNLDPQLNPSGVVNTDVRAIALFRNQLIAGGIGILISPDTLYTAPIRGGDRLHVLAPPQPLPSLDPTAPPVREQKWLLQDRDGFVGMVMAPTPQDMVLEPALEDDPTISEVATLDRPPDDQQTPILTLLDPIQNSYDPATVTIYANVVPATHGETVAEDVLGSGDGSQPNQEFVLKQKPLTYTTAPTSTGAETTLEVRVNQVLWREVESLYGRSRQDQVYTTQQAEDGTVTLIFGDGTSGMRLPTGLENVVARYRAGIGLLGVLGRDRLSLLKVRPLGIAEVTNPLPTTGAADPETMAEARASAPLTVRTLGRIVSLQDYEDFARSFAGIGKAQAAVIETAGGALIHITVAAVGGEAVLPDTPLYDNLIQAIARSRDPVQHVQVDSCETLLFNLEARLLLDERYLSDRVLANVRHTLLTRFAFEQRQFGQAVTTAEVIAAMQAVEGVVAVDLDALYRRDQARSLQQSLMVAIARWNEDQRQILPAQLLLINPGGVRLRAETSL